MHGSKILRRLQHQHESEGYVVSDLLVALLPQSGKLLHTSMMYIRRLSDGKDLLAERVVVEQNVGDNLVEILGVDLLYSLADQCLMRALGSDEVGLHLQDPMVDSEVPAAFKRLDAALWGHTQLFGQFGNGL